MSQIGRSALFAKLNPVMYKILESAFMFARLRENKYVELVHWLFQLVQSNDNDLHCICSYFGVNHDRLMRDLQDHIQSLKSGYEQISDFSEDVVGAIEEAWLYTSLKFEKSTISSGHLIYTLLESNQYKHHLRRITEEFYKIKADDLFDNYSQICQHSTENSYCQAEQKGLLPHDEQSALKKFGINLTEQARNNLLDPVIARDDEIRQMIDILLRKRQNNPLLTGEAGVGKTAVVEGLAIQIAENNVPDKLKNVEIILLDMGSLKAGASISGEFEKRIKSIINEVNQSTKPIILFIDEIHTLIGAGGTAGTADAANLLKPALARGELRTIGATTWSEYKKYFEKDPALTRRFQVIQVKEPSEEVASIMLRALIDKLEKHHGVAILDDSIVAAVKLSSRYIPARQLPDKAISILDTACARVATSLYSLPTPIAQTQQAINSLELQVSQLKKQDALGYQIDDELMSSLNDQILILQNELDQSTALYNQQKYLVEQVLEIRNQISYCNNEDCDHLKERQRVLLSQLNEIQQQAALVYPVVDTGLIAQIVAEWTGIPVGKMMDDEVALVLDLADRLDERIIGQSHATKMIATRIQTARANLDNPNKPIGVFMLTGSSGVGKTETALALADILYGGEQNLITVNMSEYQEAHTISTLKGAPPGYVGYGEGGVLTEAVRRRPYSVILLDEIEKAHPDVHEIFFQVFDKGFMEDGEGRYIDFKNTVIILTTNVGSELILTLCADDVLKPDAESLNKALREPLLKVFPAALLGRIQNIPYYPLNKEMMDNIITLQLNQIVKRILQNHNIRVMYTDKVVSLISSRCQEIESGGRMIDSVITNHILPNISLEILSLLGSDVTITDIQIDANDHDFTFAYIKK